MGMKKSVTRLLSWTLALLLLVGMLPGALAGEAGGENTPETTEAAMATEATEATEASLSNEPGEKAALSDARHMVELVTETNPEDADMPLNRLDIPQASYYTDFSYDENVLFSGIFKTHRYYFQVSE